MRTRLTEDQKKQLLLDYAAKMPLAEIGAKYRISTYYPIRLARKAGLKSRAAPANPKRFKKRKWTVDNPEKRAAHKAVEYALARGDLTREPCERCGAKNAHAHHDDYSKPLEVHWFCPQHHKDRHRELRCEAA